MTIESALKLSRPEVGSSSKIIDGSVISSTPIAVLFLSPPESDLNLAFPIKVSLAATSPSSFKSSSTLLSYSSLEIVNFNLAANLKASLGVKLWKMTSSYIT